jgi:cytoskeletal protein RodZ
MKRFFSLITFLGLLGLGMNLAAQQTPATTPDQSGASQQTPSSAPSTTPQTPSSTDQSGAAQQAPSAQQPVDAQSQQSARSFSGKIAKTGDKLVLQDSASQTSYQLDDQDKAKQFEGQSVKVTGTMDPATNTLHVVDISPNSK